MTTAVAESLALVPYELTTAVMVLLPLAIAVTKPVADTFAAVPVNEKVTNVFALLLVKLVKLRTSPLSKVPVTET